jgi:ribosomal protein L3 glutamine methyltransferase
LVLWQLGLPLDTPLDKPDASMAHGPTVVQAAAVRALVQRRIAARLPAAYLTGEAWLHGVPFLADARAIVPRSLIAELLVSGTLDCWLPQPPRRVLDLCTGGGSLAILAAMQWPGATVDGADLSADALAVASLNVQRHGLDNRVHLLLGDAWNPVSGRYDLVLCNPPYVPAASMRTLPPEYVAEPAIALAGGDDGMDFVRVLVRHAPEHMAAAAVLVLEVGHERGHFEVAFPDLEAVWLDTDAGGDQVCVLTRSALANRNKNHHPTGAPTGRPLPHP